MNILEKSISSLGEKGLIERIIDLSSKRKSYSDDYFLNRIGDDCSVIKFQNKYLITSTDMLIQEYHFPDEMSYYDMGFKAVTVNVSDLASMGAKPLGFLMSVALKRDIKVSEFDELLEGVLDACDFYNIPLLGGDTNDSDGIIISGTAIGYTDKEPMMKYGFDVGDLVCVTGRLGLAALGFQLLNLDYPKSKTSKDALERALKPISRLEEGMKLLDLGVKTATDITDGLASEFQELINSDRKYNEFIKKNSKYNKGIRIFEDKLPIDEEYKSVVKDLNLDLYDLVLHTGEDFELIFIIPKRMRKDIEKYMDFYVIGEITDSNTLEIVPLNGEIKTLSSNGYEHLT